ncbi:unnamed protein product, partial [Rangifer tarandus platyrhynchus]
NSCDGPRSNPEQTPFLCVNSFLRVNSTKIWTLVEAEDLPRKFRQIWSRLWDYSIPLSSEATGDRGQNPNWRIIIGSLLSRAHTIGGCGEDCHTFWLYWAVIHLQNQRTPNVK